MKGKDMINKVDTRESVRIITSNRLITANGLGNLSLYARKLFLLAISQCRQSDKEFFEYQISASDFAELTKVRKDHICEMANKLTDELLQTVIVEQSTKKSDIFLKFTIFSKCSYDGSSLYFKLNPDMTDFLLHLRKNFSKPLLRDFMPMKSIFSMTIWHLMQREMQSLKPDPERPMYFRLALDELRTVTGTEEKFQRISQFKSKVLNKAIDEIKALELADITYTDVKKGHSVVAFDFTARFAGIDYYNLFFAPLPDTPQKDYIVKRTRLVKLRSEAKERPLTTDEKKEMDALELEVGQFNSFSRQLFEKNS